jgi:pyruvate/2-oxoglutarate/acetoin dehydrogenase E1 component
MVKTDGMSAEVVDLAALRLLDLDTVPASVRKTNRLGDVEEGPAVVGAQTDSSAIGEQLVEIETDKATAGCESEITSS